MHREYSLDDILQRFQVGGLAAVMNTSTRQTKKLGAGLGHAVQQLPRHQHGLDEQELP